MVLRARKDEAPAPVGTYEIDPSTGFPVVPEGQLWRVRKLQGNYTSYQANEYDVYEDERIPGESVMVELVHQYQEKRTTRYYITSSGGAMSRPTPDGSGVYWDEDYQYKLKPVGVETVTETHWEGVFRPRQVTVPVQRPIYEKEYLLQDREDILGTEFARYAKPRDLVYAASKILDRVAANKAREAILGDYPPKKLELI